jgi:ABC-type branched-subunit amino acid transport system substrate-binding protein
VRAGAQVRRWYRGASVAERATTGAVIAAAVGLLLTSVALAPPDQTTAGASSTAVAAGRTGETGLTPAEVASGAAAAAGGQGTAQSSATGSGGGGATAGPGSAVVGGRTAGGVVRTASDRGVAPTKIKIGFFLQNTAGLASAGFSTGQRQDGPQYVDALAKWASKNGGVAGREVVPVFRYTDPTSVEDQAAACRAMVDDNKVFGLVDVASILDTAALDCIVRPDSGNTPFVHSAMWSSEWQKRSGGNEVSYQAAVDRISITWARDLAAMKWFPPGATIGILGDKCPATEPVVMNVLAPALKAKGAGKVVFGLHDCDIQAVVSQPANIVTQFRLAGVTHVLVTSNFVTGQLFTNAAASQGYHPKYSTSDWFLNTSNVTTANFDPTEFDGAIGIASQGTVLKASGKKPYDGWQVCSQIATDAGLPPINPGDSSSEELLDLCDNFRLMIDAINLAGVNPTRASWRAVIPTLPARVSAQFGPSKFGPGKLSGSDFVHTLLWQASCRCYHSVSDFRPAAA